MANGDITEFNLSLKANDHLLLVFPKGIPSFTLPPMHLLQLKLGSVHHADDQWGEKNLNKRRVLWSIAFPCQPHLVLSTKSWITFLLNYVFIFHRQWDILVIILTTSAKADRQLRICALDGRSHKDVEKTEDWKLHIPQGRVFCYLSHSNT